MQLSVNQADAIGNVLPPWPVYETDEIEAVVEVLRSGRVNQWTGDRVFAFEAEVAKVFGMAHAVAVANGSLALELALKALEIGPGDEVIVTPRSFMASATAVDIVGATPVFADIDPDNQGLTADTIAARITSRTKAVIPVHLSGWPCEMEPIMALARRHGIVVVEDCAQSPGALIDGRPAGTFGDAAAFSFCQDKIISTGGEGGLVAFTERRPYLFARSYKDHGKNFETMQRVDFPVGYRWIHDGIGTNWRMTEMQAAIGLCQLKKLPQWLAARARNAKDIGVGLRAFPSIHMPEPRAGIRHAYYRLGCRVVPKHLRPGWDRDRLLASLSDCGIGCSVGSCPEIYLEGAYAGRSFQRCETARAVGETVLLFAVHPTIGDSYLDSCRRTINRILTEATQ
jgi:dTDP-4-amino-4,6-dideoxygalactose transaminase